MPNELQDIRTFPQLVAYLRDEMHWPISGDHFEKLTFDFTPEELGIDMKNAAKVKEIKQLRPFSANQPWGIFFVNFEPKQLPVVALRRILGSLALKQRASANESDRKAWSQDDLLFVSNYGEGEERKICLAHFAQSDKKKDLPVLKVLGWDNLDTPLHLDHVADVLTEKLTWPSDGDDVDHWRSQWRSAFTLEHRETIKTSKQLAIALAELARNIRDRINTVLRIESEDGRVTKLMSAFKEALVDDLDEDGFADMYAQTIAYGLLSARIANPKGDTADGVAAAMPVTNPFLKELLETFLHTGGRDTKNKKGIRLDFDELGVGDVVELLDAANMEEVVLDFGDKNPQEDPVIHFYELFLKEYDPKMRMARGVFYTPRPVVSFIVRSVDELLRTEFDLEDGLADTTTWGEMCKRIKNLEIPDGATPEQVFVQILDPATGTGTFLVEVIDLIHKTMTEKWKAAGHGKKKIIELWNEYVPEHLLPRLHGYELMMAPYAIAHMKIGLKLYETGYCFESNERARVYLTNTLEPAQDFSGTLAFAIPALAHEAEAVNSIKQDQRFTVVIGNPPYLAEAGRGGRWIADLMRGKTSQKHDSVSSYFEINGATIGEKNPKWLNDEYVKFIRFSQYLLEQAGAGLLGFISNNGYLDNPTFRGMRESLINSFNSIIIHDLHGSTGKKEVSLDGTKDENVFAIKQGVGIGFFIKTDHSRDKTTEVYSSDWFGLRTEKYSRMLGISIPRTEMTRVLPTLPFLMYVPQDKSLADEYAKGFRLSEIFIIGSGGIATGRDAFSIRWNSDELWEVLNDFISLPVENARIKYKLRNDVRDWKVHLAQNDVRETGPDRDKIVEIMYRPFDKRVTYYTGKSCGFLCMPRSKVMKHFIKGENIGMSVARSVRGAPWRDALVSNTLIEFGYVATRPGNSAPLFPLYTYEDESLLPSSKCHNFAESFLQAFKASLNKQNCVLDAFHYIYAQLYSQKYRDRYSEFLKFDFPHIFLTYNKSLSQRLCQLGADLTALHLLDEAYPSASWQRAESDSKSPLLQKVVAFDSNGAQQVDRGYPKYENGKVYINPTAWFDGVPVDVWEFYIGSYQVCHKWLKERCAKKGKPAHILTESEISQYQKIVVALSETIRIMGEIDEVIEEHGGWPDAFATNTENE